MPFSYLSLVHNKMGKFSPKHQTLPAFLLTTESLNIFLHNWNSNEKHTTSMDQNPSWKLTVKKFWPFIEYEGLLWRCSKQPIVDLSLSHLNEVLILTPYLKWIWIILLHLHQNLIKCSHPLKFSNQTFVWIFHLFCYASFTL